MKSILILLGIIIVLSILLYLAGLALPMQHIAKKTIVLKASQDAICNMILDINRYPDWRKELKSVQLTGDHSWIEIDDSGEYVAYAFESINKPSQIVTAITDKTLPYGGKWVFDVEQLRDSTSLTITEYGEVYNPIFRIISRFVFGHTATVEKYQHNLSVHFHAQ